MAAVVFGGLRAASADQCIPDDLIVDGSVNIGFDSVCNRSFSFDTLVLSENNLRITFDDTSNSASFPTRNWEIRINDSANGGRNMFAIIDQGNSGTGGTGGTEQFTIEGGADNNSIYVDSSGNQGGNVGFGTSNPVVDLHVLSGNTPTLRLDQDGSSGFTPQVWDLAGNEANFFIRDVTNGSKLPFRITPNTPTNAIRMFTDKITINDGQLDYDTKIRGDNVENLFYVDASVDRVGIGTNAPASSLTVAGDDGNSNQGIRVVGTVPTVRFQDTDATTSYQFRANADRFEIQSNNMAFNSAASRLSLTSAGFLGLNNQVPALPLVIGTNNTNGNGANVTTGGVFMNGSSREFKENIKDVATDEAREAVMNLKPVKYNYKLEPGEEYAGFIAEDVPELVATNNRKYLSPMDIVSVVTKVVQDQQQTIERQQEAISTLSKRLEQLEAQSPAQD